MADINNISIQGGQVDRSTERSDSFIDDDSDFVKLFVGQVMREKSMLYLLNTDFINECV
jgi:hypothetical protein